MTRIADEAAFADLLPFLANVKAIRSHRAGPAGLRPLMDVSVADGAVRLSRGDALAAGRRRLSVHITSGNRMKVEFAGVEEATSSPTLELDFLGESGERFSDYAASASRRHGLLYPR
ncbi:MAG: hypothetical protein FD149_2676, partial [Rhodospirillaceae bacterium]